MFTIPSLSFTPRFRFYGNCSRGTVTECFDYDGRKPGIPNTSRHFLGNVWLPNHYSWQGDRELFEELAASALAVEEGQSWEVVSVETFVMSCKAQSGRLAAS